MNKYETTVTIKGDIDTIQRFLSIVQVQYNNACEAYGKEIIEIVTRTTKAPPPSLTIDQIDQLLKYCAEIPEESIGVIVNKACKVVNAPPCYYAECEHCEEYFPRETSIQLCDTCTPLYYDAL